jgi:hypothetical protein
MRYEEFEFRRNLNSELNTYPEIVKWVTYSDDDKFCFTLLWFKENEDGWYVEFVGDRPLKEENREELWKMMEYGQAVLDAELKLEN